MTALSGRSARPLKKPTRQVSMPAGRSVALSLESEIGHPPLTAKIRICPRTRSSIISSPGFTSRRGQRRTRSGVCRTARYSRPNVRNVAAENHFYRLREISHADIDFIRAEAIKDSPERLKPLHERLLQQFASPHAAKAHFEQTGTGTPEQLDAIERDIAEANENFHQSIEETFQPCLKHLRAGDLTFLSSNEDTVNFYRGPRGPSTCAPTTAGKLRSS